MVETQPPSPTPEVDFDVDLVPPHYLCRYAFDCLERNIYDLFPGLNTNFIFDYKFHDYVNRWFDLHDLHTIALPLPIRAHMATCITPVCAHCDMAFGIHLLYKWTIARSDLSYSEGSWETACSMLHHLELCKKHPSQCDFCTEARKGQLECSVAEALEFYAKDYFEMDEDKIDRICAILSGGLIMSFMD